MYTAAELYNQYLGIFNNEDQEYRDLLADVTQDELINDGNIPASEDDFTDYDFFCLRDTEIADGYLPAQSDLGEADLFVGDYHFRSNEIPGGSKAFVGMAKVTGGYPHFTHNYRSVDYLEGQDEDLYIPDDTVDTPDNFVFATNSVNGVGLTIGDYNWTNAAQDWEDSPWLGQSAGSAYGQISFLPTGGNWLNFAETDKEGLMKFKLPRLASGDEEGGYFEFWYDRTAFLAAFNNNASAIIISKEGSVYKGSISNANLVVRFNGDVGQAGGASSEIGGGAAGAVVITPKENSVWDDFGGSSDNGTRSIMLPPLSISEMQVGKSFLVRDQAPFSESQVFIDDFTTVTPNDEWVIENMIVIYPSGSISSGGGKTTVSVENGVGLEEGAEVQTKTSPATDGPTFESTLDKVYKIKLNFISFTFSPDTGARMTLSIGGSSEVIDLTTLSASQDYFYYLKSDTEGAPLVLNFKNVPVTTGSSAILLDEIEILELTCN